MQPAVTSPSVQRSRHIEPVLPRAEEIIAAIRAASGPLPQIELSYEPEIRTLWLTLKPEPKPVFTLPIITSVHKVQRSIVKLWADSPESPILFFAYRATGQLFSLGGDLDYYLDCLAGNDRAGLAEYANRAVDVILLNSSGLSGMAVTLATIHAKALGGGIDPARACNVMIGEEQATFSYPEINYNHFPISAVPILSRHTGPIEAERILMSGAEYTAKEFFDCRALDDMVPNGTGEDWIRNYARRCLPTHRARVALFAAFSRRAGRLDTDLAEAAAAWVNHIMTLRPMEISKLQRIVQAQERMLSRMTR
jgi:DSF synthase